MTGSRLTVVLGSSALLLAACSDGDGSDDPGSASGNPVSFDCDGVDTTHPGHIVIRSEDDLAQLEGIRAIEGELQLDTTSLTDLDFLGCVEEVGDHLTIFDNDALTSVDGLASLRRVGGAFIVSENSALTELDGAANLTEVGDSMIIQGNEAMTGVSGLTSLGTIGAALNIRSNDSLVHIDGLKGLRTVGGQLAITQNPNLCISSVNEVGSGITDPAEIPDNWSTSSNDDSC